ncbi:D-alanyl-D-alanine carboxypeptidase/D-alanyl-D-alanine-endopeptidase [Azonexus sp.]|uniref:D-alanyl-D-alanine carboxypeptidase/D-alanyl-D-alanine endopeptidase n=1 Tax=Azonexus sp. TaxID=1872668 RepID=UPI0027BAAAF1|nr:D-alanyl-D-alanine carboxypeptidase/D-alanyl-D-alanine-endopeptidase [Azonexus sp.]
MRRFAAYHLVRLALSLLPLIGAADVLAQLPPPVVLALHAAQIPLQNVGIVVQAVDSGAPLIEHNSRQAMNPASVMKLVTTYAALDLLGPAYVWQTSALADNVAVNGVLAGNLYLKGSGDPKFAIEHLSSLLRQLRVRGIERIAGDIVLDRSAFAPTAFDPAAFDNKPLRPYNIGPNGLLINFQALRFTLQAQEGQPRILLETPSADLYIDNRLRSTGTVCGSDWKDRINLALLPDGGRQRLEITGTYAVQCGERALSLSPLSAEAHDKGLILSLWQELGGRLSGRVRDGATPPAAQLLASHESPPLADAVRDINKFSNNVMARQVFLTLSQPPQEVTAPAKENPPEALRTGGNFPANTERAGQRINDWLSGRGLRFPELVIDNGSGLSRSERISAGSLNRLLLDAWQNPLMPEFIASMPLVGIDGTMKKRLNGSPVTGRAHIKTGTLNGVRSAAGYALDARGRRYALSFLINDPRAQQGGVAIDALLTWIAQRQ